MAAILQGGDAFAYKPDSGAYLDEKNGKQYHLGYSGRFFDIQIINSGGTRAKDISIMVTKGWEKIVTKTLFNSFNMTLP